MANNTNLTQAEFRIDPTQALIEYVLATKPYHTKILETLVEYIYTDQLNVSITEKWSWDLTFTRPDVDVVYTCGYGYRWGADDVISPEAIPTVKIISAVAEDSSPANTFLVTPALYPPAYGPAIPFDCLVINTQSNQLAFVNPYMITAVNPGTKTWTVTGNVPLNAGDTIYVNSNSTDSANGTYTVAVDTIPGPSTNIIVNESIYPLATASGTVNVVVNFDDAPYWPTGTKVQVSTTGIYPTPLSPANTYYFIPTATAGIFNLATKRYPQQFSDFINLTSAGTGTLTIIRTEPFSPGDMVTVSSSYAGDNNGTYIITSVEPESGNFRLGVAQKVQRTTTTGPYDGVMTLNVASYGDGTGCALSSAPDLYVGASITESLQFTFELMPQDFLGTQIVEDQQSVGYGSTPFDAPYDSFVESFLPYTAINHLQGNSGTHMVLPTGYDTQLFDLGGIDETLNSVTKNYGHTVPM